MKKFFYILIISCVTLITYTSNNNIQTQIASLFGKEITKIPTPITNTLQNLVKEKVITKENFHYLLCNLYPESHQSINLADVTTNLEYFIQEIRQLSLLFSMERMNIE